MNRRQFLGSTMAAAAASLPGLGCDPDERRAAAKVVASAIPVVCCLPIEVELQTILAVGLQITSSVISCDCIWQDERRDQKSEPQSIHAEIPVSPSQDTDFKARKPVLFQNARLEDCTPKVIIAKEPTLVLANQPKMYELSYRCPGLHELRTTALEARLTAVRMNVLQIPWVGRSQDLDILTVTYGSVWAWQRWYTPDQIQAEAWRGLLLETAGFEVNLKQV